MTEHEGQAEEPVPTGVVSGHGKNGTIYSVQNGNSLLHVAATVVATAAVLPFVQALAAQAGQRAFERARGLVASLIRKTSEDPPQNCLLILRDDGHPITFQVPQGLPDEALQALTTTDIEALAAPDPKGREVRIHWESTTAQWQRTIVHRSL
ncbi:hypothetical protein ACFVUW_11585 [Streptomyces xiamenensis]|uniref:hypothetical protein n=1 Tax=Streptomyces xiamenensis TaxID=408015 RepID=UPI0036E6999F